MASKSEAQQLLTSTMYYSILKYIIGGKEKIVTQKHGCLPILSSHLHDAKRSWAQANTGCKKRRLVTLHAIQRRQVYDANGAK